MLSALPASTNLASVGGLLQAISALVKTGTGAPVATTGPSTDTSPAADKRMTCADGTPGSVRFSI